MLPPLCPGHGQCYITSLRVSSNPLGTPGFCCNRHGRRQAARGLQCGSAPAAATSSEDCGFRPGACLGSTAEGQGRNTNSRVPSSHFPTHRSASCSAPGTALSSRQAGRKGDQHHPHPSFPGLLLLQGGSGPGSLCPSRAEMGWPLRPRTHTWHGWSGSAFHHWPPQTGPWG